MAGDIPAAELGAHRFGGDGPRLLLAGNAGHADIPLDAPGSGLMGLLMTMLGQTVGFPVPVGGAGELTQALARRFTSLGALCRRRLLAGPRSRWVLTVPWLSPRRTTRLSTTGSS